MSALREENAILIPAPLGEKCACKSIVIKENPIHFKEVGGEMIA
jgi:hypothetical protein